MILILGDLNVHAEFLNIIDSFNLLQWVNYPTHIHGHMLDQILSYGLSVIEVPVVDSAISDHFLSLLLHLVQAPYKPVHIYLILK